MIARSLGVPLAAWLCIGCALGGSVVRVVDGQEIRGRAIGTSAYANYTRGMLLEVAEKYADAEKAYQQAVEDDPDSPELWTRLGRVRCRLGRSEDSASAFERVNELDAEYGPLFIARAECARDAGDHAKAQAFAQRAVALDPQNPHAISAVITALEGTGDKRQALAWAIAAALEHASPSAWELVARLAKGANDPGWALRGSERANALRAAIVRNGGGVESCDISTRDELDRTIVAGKLGLARGLANRCRLGPGALASRAAALGAAKLAQAQALHVLAADPADADARVALWVSADLRGDAFPGPPPDTAASPLSPLSYRLMAEMLNRRAGNDAARAWMAAAPALPTPRDALERGIDERLRRGGIARPGTRPKAAKRQRLRF